MSDDDIGNLFTDDEVAKALENAADDQAARRILEDPRIQQLLETLRQGGEEPIEYDETGRPHLRTTSGVQRKATADSPESARAAALALLGTAGDDGATEVDLPRTVGGRTGKFPVGSPQPHVAPPPPRAMAAVLDTDRTLGGRTARLVPGRDPASATSGAAEASSAPPEAPAASPDSSSSAAERPREPPPAVEVAVAPSTKPSPKMAPGARATAARGRMIPLAIVALAAPVVLFVVLNDRTGDTPSVAPSASVAAAPAGEPPVRSAVPAVPTAERAAPPAPSAEPSASTSAKPGSMPSAATAPIVTTHQTSRPAAPGPKGPASASDTTPPPAKTGDQYFP